ncbi:hypothetical protein HY78_18570 [Rhizorhabdus wittichii DC-6]|nr:hypothetical protein HY78_18570 [Rhizorhabdus wittichii DC-6]
MAIDSFDFGHDSRRGGVVEVHKDKLDHIKCVEYVVSGIRLTWEGYDLLDAIRDPAIWRSVKRAASKVGSWSIETLAALAKAMIVARMEGIGLTA